MFPTNQIIQMARDALAQHRSESAIVALLDAITLREQGAHKEASRRALVSLKHSLGTQHPSYKRAEEILKRVLHTAENSI